jgi:flagellar secretion chaperone FliS
MSLDIANSYRQASILTADPMKLTLMCYSGAISNLKLARNAYAAKDYEAKGKALQKALDIIDELNASLDMKQGGQVAANLRGIYHYLTRTLIEADLKRDLKAFDDAVKMLEEIESAWKIVAAEKNRTAEAKYKTAGIPYGGVGLGVAVGARVWST